MKTKLISAGMSYLRAALAAVAALTMSGVTDPKVLANAFIAGLLGPLLKAIDPKQTEYGLNAK
jgi:hypothetical protein